MPFVAEPARPVSLGVFIRRLIAGKMNQLQLAEASGLRPAQITKIVNGGSVLSEQYEQVARALKYRNALEMFKAPEDVLTRRLLRLWAALGENDAARRDVLQQIKRTIDEDEGLDATSGGASAIDPR
jgi:transcriptional regulator with XRE-family HTH domain